MPPEPLTPVEQQEILQSACAALAGMADAEAARTQEEWSELRMRVACLGTQSEYAIELDCTRATRRPGAPPALYPLVKQLRKGMYREGAGTWFTLSLRIGADRGFRASYDYEGEPDIRVVERERALQQERAMYPREAAATPGWLAPPPPESGSGAGSAFEAALPPSSPVAAAWQLLCLTQEGDRAQSSPSGETAAAGALFEEAARTGDPAALYGLGRSLLGSPLHEDADLCFAAVDVRTDPRPTAELASRRLHAERYAEAAELYRKARTDGGLRLPSAAVGEAAALSELGWVPRALELVDPLAESGDVRALTRIAALLRKAKRHTEAKRALRAAAAAFPAAHRSGELSGNDGAELAGLLVEYKEFDRTSEELLDPLARAGTPNALAALGRLYDYQQRTDEAAEFLGRAFRAGHAEAALLLGKLLRRQERFAESEEPLRLAHDRGVDGGADRLAATLADLGRPGEAAEVLEPLASGGDTDALNELGRCLFAQRHYADAEEAFRAAVAAGSGPAVRNLGLALREQDRAGEAEQWFRRAADEHGSADARRNLADLLISGERHDEAIAALRPLAEDGDRWAITEIGRCHMWRDSPADAEPWFRAAFEAGSVDGAYNLGVTHERLDRPGEAEDWYRRAIDDHDYAEARHALSRILSRDGRRDEAVAVLRPLADAGDADAANAAGCHLFDQQRYAEAEPDFRTAAAAGSVEALRNLGLVLREQGRGDEAAEWFRRSVEAGGSTDARWNLSDVLAAAGNSAEAVEALRPLADAGDGRAANRVGVLHFEAGQAAEAEEWFRAAAGAGFDGALRNVGQTLRRLGRSGEAEDWFRRAAGEGDTAARCNLVEVLRDAGRTAEAEEEARTAAEDGSERGLDLLYLVLTSDDRAAEAEKYLRGAGDRPHAMYLLGMLLAEQQRADESAEWFDRAAHRGSVSGMNEYGRLLRKRGEEAEGRRWFRRAAEGGDPAGAYNHALVLESGGDRPGALDWLEKAAERGQAAAVDALVRLLSEPADDPERLARWRGEQHRGLREAAEQGDAKAALRLGREALAGQDRARAAELFGVAAQAGDPDAAFALAELLAADGRVQEAIYQYDAAARQDHVGAAQALVRTAEQLGEHATAQAWRDHLQRILASHRPPGRHGPA